MDKNIFHRIDISVSILTNCEYHGFVDQKRTARSPVLSSNNFFSNKSIIIEKGGNCKMTHLIHLVLNASAVVASRSSLHEEKMVVAS